MKKPASYSGHYGYDCDGCAINHDHDSRSSCYISHIHFHLHDYDRHGSDQHVYPSHGKAGHRAGSASALLGMLPLLLGSIVSPLVGINETTAVPMGAIMFVTAVIGSLAFLD